jgi:hypothetical protein
MKSLLFGAVIAMMSLPAAYASESTSQTFGERTCKWCGSSAYSLPCHFVKERIGTRHGHPVYQTRQVCG